MRPPTRLLAAALAAVAVLIAGCSASPIDPSAERGTTTTSGAAGEGTTIAPASDAGGLTDETSPTTAATGGSSEGPPTGPVGTAASPASPGGPRTEGRYVEEVFPEIEQVYDDAVFKTAAEAPGFGGKPAKDLMIDVWVPKGDDAPVRPLMIFQFGGGFRFGDRNQLAGLAQSAAHRGFVTAAFDYRTGTGWQDEGLLPGVRDDAEDAVNWLLAHQDGLRFDPDVIISTGASAGAVNSIHMITMPSQPGDVRLAGVVSLSGANLIGDTKAVTDGPPVIMFSGSADTIVPYRLQTRTCDDYQAAGNTCEQHVYDGAGHMGGDQADIKAQSIRFVDEQILRPLGY